MNGPDIWFFGKTAAVFRAFRVIFICHVQSVTDQWSSSYSSYDITKKNKSAKSIKNVSITIRFRLTLIIIVHFRMTTMHSNAYKRSLNGLIESDGALVFSSSLWYGELKLCHFHIVFWINRNIYQFKSKISLFTLHLYRLLYSLGCMASIEYSITYLKWI